MKQLDVLLAFDHELSLGAAHSYEENLFTPTRRLYDLAAEIQVPLVLFTDVCCALRFRDWDHDGFFRPYREQIQAAAGGGHDVQLHLHPHWLDSDFEDGRFVPSRSYSLAAFHSRPKPDDIPGIVGRGVELLEELCRPVLPGYRCIAYRAGGYKLAPRTAEILDALHAAGIRIDSSIAKGMRSSEPDNAFDYGAMPNGANWFIAPTGPLEEPAPSGILEIPIAARPRNPLNNLPFLVRRALWKRRAHSSGGASLDALNAGWSARLARLFPRTVWPVCFDNHARPLGDIMASFRQHLRRHRFEDRVICSTVSHPKYMGPAQRELMARFVEELRREYRGVLRFVSSRQIYDEFFASAGEPRADGAEA